MERGQISYFFLMSIVLLILFSFVFYVGSLGNSKIKNQAETRAFPDFAANAKNFVQSCVEFTGKNALKEIGLSGSLLNPSRSINQFFYKTSYLVYEGITYFPGIGQVENDISYYMDGNLNNCLDNLSSLKDQGFNINIGKPHTTTKIINNSVLFNTELPIKIKSGDEEYSVSNFQYISNVRLGKIYHAAGDILYKTITRPDYIDTSLFNSYDLNIVVAGHIADSIIYTITDNQSLIDKKPYTFVFATHPKTVDLSAINKAPRFINLRNFDMSVGQGFYYDFDAVDYEGESITYEAITALFSINRDTGIVSFTPESFDIGTHEIRVAAIDAGGNIGTGIIRVNII